MGGFSSTLGVTVSSSLPLFVVAALALDLVVFFLLDDSAAGVLGVVNLSLVAVLGVFAGLALSVNVQEWLHLHPYLFIRIFAIISLLSLLRFGLLSSWLIINVHFLGIVYNSSSVSTLSRCLLVLLGCFFFF